MLRTAAYGDRQHDSYVSENRAIVCFINKSAARVQ